MRNRRTPVNPPGTGRRGFIRSAFAAASQFYGAMSPAQQAAWASFADSHPITDKLGQSIKLTAHQMSVAVNTQLQNVGEPMAATVPVALSPVAFVLTSITAAAGTPAFTFTPSGGGNAGDFYLYAFSPQLSGGRGFNNRWWQAGHIAADASTPVNVLAAYTAEFGVLTAGNRIFYKFTPVSVDGWSGTPTIGFVTVAP